ncbi:hypothetical protein ACFQH8_16655 [Halomicroarcula sp. GCM10025710]
MVEQGLQFLVVGGDDVLPTFPMQDSRVCGVVADVVLIGERNLGRGILDVVRSVGVGRDPVVELTDGGEPVRDRRLGEAVTDHRVDERVHSVLVGVQRVVAFFRTPVQPASAPFFRRVTVVSLSTKSVSQPA